MKTEIKKTVEADVVRDCPILFKMYNKTCMETCMCWGFECEDGWHRTIASACRELELLNLTFYPKYRVRILADQIKEKYGTLRFYMSVVHDHGTIVLHAIDWLKDIARWLEQNVNFKIEYVEVARPYVTVETEELTAEQYKRYTSKKSCVASGKLYQKDGKFYREYELNHAGVWISRPTKHKLLHKVKRILQNFSLKLDVSWFSLNIDSKTANCIEFMDRRAQAIERQLEEECANVCERCGHQIGTDWSPSCMTKGWIKFLCSDCAKKTSSEYVMNGKTYFKGKLVRAKSKAKPIKQ